MKSILPLLLLSSASALCLAGDPERPPKLTLGKHVDYLKWYDEFVGKGRDPSQNAFDLYCKIWPVGEDVAHIEEFPEECRPCYSMPWNPRDFPETKTFLERNNRFLEYFRQASARPFYWRPRKADDHSLMAMLDPVGGNCRRASRSLIVQGWMRGEDQNEQMLENWYSILACTNHLIQDPPLITTLGGYALRTLVYQQVRRAIRFEIIPSHEFGKAYRFLSKCAPPQLNLSQSIIYEWGAGLDGAQRNYEEKKNEADALSEQIKKWPSLTGMSPRVMIEDLDADFADMLGILKKDVSLDAISKIRKHDAGKDLKNHRHFLFSIVHPSLLRACELSLRSETERRGTLLVLAIHTHQHEFGSWPRGLADLKIKQLEAIRIDLYSEKDFIYKLSDKGPLLYSIGADGKDDGGRHDAKWGEGKDGGDFVFWPVHD